MSEEKTWQEIIEATCRDINRAWVADVVASMKLKQKIRNGQVKISFDVPKPHIVESKERGGPGPCGGGK